MKNHEMTQSVLKNSSIYYHSIHFWQFNFYSPPPQKTNKKKKTKKTHSADHCRLSIVCDGRILSVFYGKAYLLSASLNFNHTQSNFLTSNKLIK